jgi:hypothetical protein
MLDDNLDGKLQLSELKGAFSMPIRMAFNQIDANKDGAIDPGELKMAETAMAKRAQASTSANQARN